MADSEILTGPQFHGEDDGGPDHNLSADALEQRNSGTSEEPAVDDEPVIAPHEEEEETEEEEEIDTPPVDPASETANVSSKDPAVTELLQEYAAQNSAHPPQLTGESAITQTAGHNFSMGTRGEVSHAEVMGAAQNVIAQGGDSGQPNPS